MPGQPVVLDSMGGLVVTSRPEDIPEGASPRTWDTDFIVGRFIQRPGEQSVFTYKNPAALTNSGTSATNVATSVSPWTNPAGVLTNGGTSATISLGSKTLNVASTEGVSYTDPVTLQTLYYILVTFDGLTPAIGSTYTFSGLTENIFLNGKIIFSVAAPFGVNGGIALNDNQALFFWGDSVFASQADTGSASVTYSSYVSDQIWIKNFGFTLALVISGIQINVKGFSPSATVFAQLLKNNVPVGEVKFAALPTSLGTVTIGGDKDTWQEVWADADLNDSNFGVAIWVSSTSPNTVSLDWVTVKVTEGLSNTNFNGSSSAKVNQNTQLSFHLDSNGTTWIENTSYQPNVLYQFGPHPPLVIPSPLIPKAVPGSYLKGIDANGNAYLAYSDLTQGTSAPMQYNGQWCDRITQVGPGAPPVFTASTDAGAQAAVSAYSASAGILTLTIGALSSAYVAGLLVTFSEGTGALAALNGLTFSVLGSPAPTTTSFAIATGLVMGSGSATATVTPQYTYPIVASPNGIVQPPAQSDPDSPGHFSALLWSAGPGQKTAGNTVTVYYKNSFTHTTPDQTLVDAFNSGRPVYVYIANAPFGNGTWQVTSLGNAIPPGAGYYRWYFTYEVPTSNYQFYGGPDDATGTYQLTYATITTTTAVPGLAAGNQIILQNVTNSNWDHTYDVTAALNSGSYSITQTQLTAGVATYSWSLITGDAPVVGQLVTVTGTLNANGQLNVTDAVIQSATGSTSGTFTVSGFSAVADYPSAIEAGQATTAGTQFIIDPGAALVGTTSQSPIIGNSGGGTLTVVGASVGGSFPIDPGTYQGTCFFITRNGAVTCPAPPFIFTVTAGANYITASQIPIGPDNVIARGIVFTEPGANGIPGGNFYTYDTPVQFSVGGTKYTASALIVPDNVTTTMKFTFSTSVLLASDEIDIPGNDYFNLIEIGDPAWIYQYANRMFYGLCRTKIQNFLNMSFDGGYLPNPNGLPMPLGWKSPGFPQVAYDITIFTIVSNVVIFQANNHLVAGNQVFIDGLSTGTYLNGLVLTVLPSNLSSTQFSAAFTHADVGITSDSGTATVINQQIGLIESPIFGNAFQILNQSTSALTDTVILYQSAYQDWQNVPILNINTDYSVRLTANALNVDGQLVSIRLFDPDTQTQYGLAVFSLDTGDPVQLSMQMATPIATIPHGLQIQVIATNLAAGGGVEIDRVEVFETNRPVDTTTIWVSYADKFESVDINTGRLGVGVDNPQPAVGAYQILEQLYIEKTNSLQVTQDSPNYEPNEWSVHQASEKTGAVGPNAFDEGEEFSLSVARNGVYYFDGGKKMPISRELQSTGFQGSLWETINWNAKQTIWCRNDFLNRRILIGVPMKTPNFWLPYAPEEVPTSPNVILMCNYTGCPTGDELQEAGEVHVTMFGDMKALDMRRKWSIWQVRCPSASFIPREDGETELLLGNGIGSGKIYKFVNGAPANGQNTDDGEPINWLYTTYGFMKAKQGQQLGTTALRKVAEYMTATMEGVGQVACRILINTLGALTRNTFQVRPNFTLSYPAQNDQESNLEVAGQRMFFEFSSVGTGGYAEIGQLMVDMQPDMHSPHRGIRA